MSPVDEIQQQFDRALSELSPVEVPSPGHLHQRLHRRRLRLRAAGLVGLAVMATGIGVGVTTTNSPMAAAVTLRAEGGPGLTRSEVAADAIVMRQRLNVMGDRSATVKVEGRSIVVTGGPSALIDPTSILTQSPSLLVRPVLCLGAAHSGVPQLGPLPSGCGGGPYALKDTPTVGHEYPSGKTVHGYSYGAAVDPNLTPFLTTSPEADLSHPEAIALLPSKGGDGERYLVGPTALRLSSRVASARVTKNRFGGWQVAVTLSVIAAARYDQVADQYFHQMLAVDLNGLVVTAPIIEPQQTRFSSLDGKFVMTGDWSKSTADAVAAALRSGPLPIPLHVTGR